MERARTSDRPQKTDRPFSSPSHPQVTILFTDIVGFTAMSRVSLHYEVMEFLHKLFVRFDELVDRDSLLWKVETVGDAFMVAGGLDVSTDGSETGSVSQTSSAGTITKVISCKVKDEHNSAKAVVTFGREGEHPLPPYRPPALTRD